jgi:hypothetical protein
LNQSTQSSRQIHGRDVLPWSRPTNDRGVGDADEGFGERGDVRLTATAEDAIPAKRSMSASTGAASPIAAMHDSLAVYCGKRA